MYYSVRVIACPLEGACGHRYLTELYIAVDNDDYWHIYTFHCKTDARSEDVSLRAPEVKPRLVGSLMAKRRVPIFRERVRILVDDSADAATRKDRWEAAVNSEVLRLTADPTCRYCGTTMRMIDDEEQVWGYLVVCPHCGYWGGRGMRPGGPMNAISDGQPELSRYPKGALGVIRRIDLDSSELRIAELIGYLRTVPDALFDFSPFRAEKFVMDLLKEALDCEVRPVGGRNDGGVDGYIVAGEQLKTIVQVKWHRDKHRAEGVRLVREIAGTLVARGVPQGMLVTTSERMSRAGMRELEQIGRRELADIGPIRLDVRTYNDILDMLELAWTNLGGDFESVTPWLRRISDTEPLAPSRWEAFGPQ